VRAAPIGAKVFSVADPSDRPQFRLLPGGRRAADPPVDVVELPADRSAPRKARYWVARVAAQHGLLGLENQTVELLTGELVGIAAKNTVPGGTVRVEVTTTDGVVEVSAHHTAGDGGAQPSPLDTDRWGTALLRALSTDCGVEESDGGRVTSWFQVAAAI
jgi:hypothetical protein